MASRTTPAGLQVLGTPIPISFGNGVAGGCIGYAKRTTNTSAVTTQSDITGLSVAVPVNASRLIEIEVWIPAVSASDATTWGQILLLEGATVLAFGPTGQTSAGSGSDPPVVVKKLLSVTTAATRTFKVALDRAAGTGSVTMGAGTDREAYIRVNDLGPNFT